MKIEARLVRLICVSPWFLTVFLIVPFLVILRVRFNLSLPLPGVKNLLLFNNISLGLLVAVRLVYYLAGLLRATRYGSAPAKAVHSLDIDNTPAQVRSTLSAGGFRLDKSGTYGEKTDLGYFGTIIVYAGLLLVLGTGTFDNLYQFSGTLFDGQGRATELSDLKAYRDLITGPFTKAPKSLPKMKIVHQINPNATYPRGATEVAFLFTDGRETKTMLKCPDPYPLGAFDIYMSKMVYEPKLLVTIDQVNTVFAGSVMLDPLVTREHDFSFYGAFVNNNLDGEAYYQPEKSRLKFTLRQGPLVLVDKELIFQVEQQQTSGNIAFTVERMGVWSELHVVRRRHVSLLVAGGIIALLGLVMRLAIGRQRVWLEDVYGNCRVSAIGGEAKRILNKG